LNFFRKNIFSNNYCSKIFRVIVSQWACQKC